MNNRGCLLHVLLSLIFCMNASADDSFTAANGRKWISVERFRANDLGSSGLSYNEIQESLKGTGYRIAKKSEVLAFLSDHTVFNLGSAVRFSTCCSNWVAVYDDSDSGSIDGMIGVTSWSKTISTGDVTGPTHADDSLSKTEAPEVGEIIGAWVVDIERTGQIATLGQDVDRDGVDEKTIWRNSSGTWYVRLSESDNFFSRSWGLPGDYPFFGDYDGDTVPDLAVWRPTNGYWYILKSSNAHDITAPFLAQFGLPGDIPLRGDYDGDKILDPAVWRPSTGVFYYKSSIDESVTSQQWGLPNDIPVTSGRGSDS